MKRCVVILLLFSCLSAYAQGPISILSTYAEDYAATQLREWLDKGGCLTFWGRKDPGHTIHVGLTTSERRKFKPMVDSLRDDGYFIYGEKGDVWLYGKGEKGTLYAVYAFLEMLGYRLYTPSSMVVPDMSYLKLPQCRIVSNPSFAYREVSYYYPNHSQLYADWHHLHTVADRNAQWGLFVHTFGRLLPPSRYYDEHPEWFSLNNGHRSRDGQLCLSNPEVLEVLCQRLADTMAGAPRKKIWSVSPNDNYNACQCDNCRRLDSLYGGQSGTLLWFVNQVARRFPDKTISTLAYQYTRKAPTGDIRPESNVNIMLCPIEVGREKPISTSDFSKDMEDWSRLTDNIFLWDYVVQFRNFWNPFPNLHVLQPNLQYFRDNGVRMMFEQASGADNKSSWMDIRCYMIAKLLWDVDADMDSIMADFYQGNYGDAGRYVKEIVDTMTVALIQSGQRLDIYGYPIDAVDSYLSVERFHQYDSLLRLAYQHAPEHYIGCFRDIDSAMYYFGLALEFARNELAVSRDLCGYFNLDSLPSDSVSLQRVIERLESFLFFNDVPQMMEMGISPSECVKNWISNIERRFGKNKARNKPVDLRHSATAPYNTAGITDGQCGTYDYRYHWLGFWGDTLDAVIDFGEPTSYSTISISFYYYPLSWIFWPEQVIFYELDETGRWRVVTTFHIDNPEVLATPDIYTCQMDRVACIDPLHPVRQIRVKAIPPKEIPAWHRAAGEKPWIFTDEIIVK